MADTSKRVIVVDDDEDQLFMLSHILKRAGFEVSSAKGGRACLELLRGSPADIVVCDVNMPEMDGLTLSRELAARYPRIPVLLMTADTEAVAGQNLNGSGRLVIAKQEIRSGLVAAMSKLLENA